MGLLKSIAVGLVLSLTTACTQASLQDYKQLRLATKLVITTQAPEMPQGVPYGSGTGIVIAPGYVLTAWHVVDDGVDHTYVGTSKTDKIKAIVLKPGTDTLDLALLYVPGVKCPCIKVADEDAQQDTPVVQVGYPLYGLALTQFLTTGLVQNYVTADGTQFMVTTADMAPGNSGGGTFAKIGDEWRLVGVGVRVLGGRNIFGSPQMITWMSLGVPVHVIREFLKGTAVEQK